MSMLSTAVRVPEVLFVLGVMVGVMVRVVVGLVHLVSVTAAPPTSVLCLITMSPLILALMAALNCYPFLSFLR